MGMVPVPLGVGELEHGSAVLLDVRGVGLFFGSHSAICLYAVGERKDDSSQKCSKGALSNLKSVA